MITDRWIIQLLRQFLRRKMTGDGLSDVSGGVQRSCLKVLLKDLKLGDRIHAGNGIYEPVYGFGHFNVDATSDFLQI